MDLSIFWHKLVRLSLTSVAVCLFSIPYTASAGDVDALHDAAENGDAKQVSALVERGVDVNGRTGSGSYALNAAAWANDIASIKILLEHGADPNVQNTQGDTPLICATKYSGGNAATVRVLVDAGTDLTLKDEKGMTALDYAKAKGEQDAIVLLEKSGS